MMRHAPVILFCCAATAFAQQVQTTPPKPTLRELTLENIFDPKRHVAFAGAPQSGFVWLDDHTLFWPRTDENGEVVEQIVTDTETGKRRPLFDAAKLQALLRQMPGVSEEQVKKIPLQKDWTFSPDKKSALLTVAGDLFLFTFDNGALLRLSETSGDEQEPAFSPDGKSIAFVRNNNLFVTDIATKHERQLTTDGNGDTLNGILDWVYQEEIYGRGNFKGFWWSPDSSRIAFLRLDEKPVHRFTVVDHIPYLQTLEITPYPKAGDPNPAARLFTVTAAGGSPTEVTLPANDLLVVNVDWTPDSKNITFQTQNREQTSLDLMIAPANGGGSRPLIHETTPAWVERADNPLWLTDGSFVWRSERTGFSHLYHYSAAGALQQAITKGPWEVRTAHGIDKENRWLYFSGTERSVLGSDVYRVQLDGSGLTRLSDAAGTHVATFNPSWTAYVDSWSTIERPPQIAVYRADGSGRRIIDDNAPSALSQYRMAKPEFLHVPARDGFPLEAMMIRPAGFDPSRKYPVYEYTYSGPHSQQVRNAWRGAQYLYWQLVAQRGVIVWVCDNRSASGKGAQSAWPIYKNFGASELRDLEDGLQWLTSQPYVDGTRVLLDGWSFGGFMTTYALTHSAKWSAGIAGGSVTDWRDYDSIYTERYMLTPEHNREGYERTAPRFAAASLHGNLLLLHGAIDNNVHLQNTMQFAYELEKAGKVFHMVIYPKSRHGVTDAALVAQMRATMLQFVEENLLR